MLIRVALRLMFGMSAVLRAELSPGPVAAAGGEWVWERERRLVALLFRIRQPF